MPKSERAPSSGGYYAVAKQRKGRVIVTFAALSAVLATAGFLALATLTGFVRWSAQEPAVATQDAAHSPLPPEALRPSPPGDPKPIWRQEWEEESAALGTKIFDLELELEETRGEAERYRQELDDLVNEPRSRQGPLR